MLQSIQLTATNRSRAYPMRLIDMFYFWSYFLDMFVCSGMADVIVLYFGVQSFSLAIDSNY